MSVSPEELAALVRRRGLLMTDGLAVATLEYWRDRGIAERHLGCWRLTKSGQAMFGGWATAIDLEDDEAA